MKRESYAKEWGRHSSLVERVEVAKCWVSLGNRQLGMTGKGAGEQG